MYRIDDLAYKVEVLHRQNLGNNAVRIIIPTYMPNETSQSITKACVASIKKFTPETHEIWVEDNNSPEEYRSWLRSDTTLNLVLNNTEPVSPAQRNISIAKKLFWKIRKKNLGAQFKDVSYANAIGLELAIRSIPKDSKLVFTMHSDTLVLKGGWLTYLQSKMSEKVRASAFWADNMRVNALHIGGMLFDFTQYEKLNMSFMHNMRQERVSSYPEYDVGDLITIRLRENGFQTFTCQNTYNTPGLIELIPAEHPMRSLHADRCFDDRNELLYAHMGRGGPKAFGTYSQPGKTYPEQWLEFAKNFVFLDPINGYSTSKS